MMFKSSAFVMLLIFSGNVFAQNVISIPDKTESGKMYPWKRTTGGYIPLQQRFKVPANFKRVKVDKKSWAYWLRNIPLRKKGTRVYDYAGDEVPSSTAAAAAVVDLDIGNRDLQQCMDTIIRLRGEYHWWRNTKSKIGFRYYGNLYYKWSHWSNGMRPKKVNGRMKIVPGYRGGTSRKSFIKYMTYIFAMTGTVNNAGEKKVKFSDIKAGDFFVYPAPSSRVLGHAIVIMDIAENSSGEKIGILAQGFTPAQDMHILKAPGGGVWYKFKEKLPIKTPLWSPFKWSELRRFKY
ncbi:MAG: hypothetical protein JXR95_01105 [Deltaproteobacteria bacterium]|nr:hypothetical protein [Deltaproteobacteria bacterium]